MPINPYLLYFAGFAILVNKFEFIIVTPHCCDTDRSRGDAAHYSAFMLLYHTRPPVKQ